MRTALITILFATFTFAASASIGNGNAQRSQGEARNLILAQQGGVYCRKGYRWDYRQRTCVPQ